MYWAKELLNLREAGPGSRNRKSRRQNRERRRRIKR
jgi:hypothetical protein